MICHKPALNSAIRRLTAGRKLRSSFTPRSAINRHLMERQGDLPAWNRPITRKGVAVPGVSRGSAAAATVDSDKDVETFFGSYIVRLWREGDGEAVADLVSRAQTITYNGQVFNPEGDENDCFNVPEMYFEAGGSFLVVTDEAAGAKDSSDLEKVVGCASFIVGDEVVYHKDGSSSSDPSRVSVAALRRVCVRGGTLGEDQGRDLLSFLLGVLETLALRRAEGDRLQLIALGRRVTDQTSPMMLSSDILESAGYSASERFTIPGVEDIKEYSKSIASTSSEAVDGSGRSISEKGSREKLEVISTTGATLGVFPRAFVEKHNLLHRAVGVFVQNDQGDVYVHQRAPTKSVHPSMYDMFVGGLVVAGETVEQGARGEALEELGIDIRPGVADMTPMFVHEFMGPRNRVVVSCFRVVVHQTESIQHQDGEVVWGEWMPVDELKQMIEVEEFVPGGLCMWNETNKRDMVSFDHC